MILNKDSLTKIILTFFLVLFVLRSLQAMIYVPFYDFDEAHRAENAKRMRDHGSFLVPLSGSSFDRDERFKIRYKDNSNVYLYYHLERPGLIYVLMGFASALFGNNEFAYRLPSFLLGLGTILIFLFFAEKRLGQPPLSFNSSATNKKLSLNMPALAIGLVALITSRDLWLSAQYAQLDTGLTFFLFLSLMLLMYYIEKGQTKLLAFSGFSFALAVLSKGQPAVIFGIPLLTLLIMRKLSIRDFLKFIGFSLIILVPWICVISFEFGFTTLLEIFSRFAFTSSALVYTHLSAPFYWYTRWWFDSLRPGWVIFLSFLFYDLISRQIKWKRIIFLGFILAGLAFFSIAKNKIWWYVLPLVPAISFYIFISATEYLNKFPKKLLNLSLVLILASTPLFLNSTNKVALGFGLFTVILSVLTLKLELPKLLRLNTKVIHIFFLFSLIFSLLSFNLRFPLVEPYAVGVKEVATQYTKIEGHKCLWVYHLPAEAVLFYSNAGQVNELNPDSINSILYKSCFDNYLITPLDLSDPDFNFIPKKELLFKSAKISLIKISQKN